MKIVVTGGTGFIGSHFLQQSLSAGYKVIAIRRTEISTPRIFLENHPIWLTRQFDDVESSDLHGAEILVHLASHSVLYPHDSLENCLKWNLMSSLQLFEKAYQAGIRKFVAIGSCFEYGQNSNSDANIKTNSILTPSNTYGASKAAAFIALQQWTVEKKVTMDYIRLFHIYGEGEHPSRFWPSLKQASLKGVDFKMTKGDQIRDFVNVVDAAKTILNRVSNLNNDQQFRVFNLGSGNPCTLRSFAEYWWHDEWKSKGNLIFGAIQYRDNEVMRYVAGEDLLKTDEFSSSRT